MKRTLLLAGLLGVLAGCGGSGSSAAPGVLPPVSASPTSVPSASASAVAPSPVASVSVPAEPPTEKEVERTAAEVARKWVDALNKAYTTLDTTEMEALSTSACATCTNYRDGIAHSRSLGETWVGGLLTVTDIVPAEPGSDATEVLVSFTSAPFYVLTASGERLGEEPAASRAALQLLVRNTPEPRLVTQVLRL